MPDEFEQIKKKVDSHDRKIKEHDRIFYGDYQQSKKGVITTIYLMDEKVNQILLKITEKRQDKKEKKTDIKWIVALIVTILFSISSLFLTIFVK